MDASADGFLKPKASPLVTPLSPRLPRLSFDDADRENALARYRGEFVFRGRLGEMRARVCHRRAVETADIGFACLRAQIDGAAVNFWVPAKALSAVAFLAEPAVSMGDIPEEGRALLFEYVLDDLLTAVESRGHLVAITEVANPVRNPPGDLGFWASVGQVPAFPGLIEGPPVFLSQLQRAADALPMRSLGFVDLPIVLRMLAGATWLSNDGYVGLRQGDTVLIDRTWLTQHRAPVLVGDSLILSANVTSRGFALDRSGPVTDLRERATWLADDLISEGAFMSDGEAGNLETLEVKLVFEIGRFTMSLAELNRLDAGHVFELNRAPDQAVDIFVLNRQVGSGELVMVGDRIGVRLTKLNR
ncbi:MAG TPA: FliM/FliN family flagellar motor switch protein [Beijerinckiaceae bacterium]|nr:FliM/FliN family flagellar motor switch protein [Beijerinckiaceae bacterium]